MKKNKVDISYDGSITEFLKIIKRVYKSQKLYSKNGGGVINKIFKRLLFKLKGVDFVAQENHNLEVIGGNKEHSTVYVATSSHVIIQLINTLRGIDDNLLDGTFCDLGSGKGSVVIEAYKQGFKKCIGVEFVKKFHYISLENIKKLLDSKAEDSIVMVNDDAVNFKFPSDTRLIFFYNPFDEVVMKSVLENICNVNYKNRVFIIYHNPVYRDLFTSNNKIKLLTRSVSITNEECDIFEILL